MAEEIVKAPTPPPLDILADENVIIELEPPLKLTNDPDKPQKETLQTTSDESSSEASPSGLMQPESSLKLTKDSGESQGDTADVTSDETPSKPQEPHSEEDEPKTVSPLDTLPPTSPPPSENLGLTHRRKAESSTTEQSENISKRPHRHKRRSPSPHGSQKDSGLLSPADTPTTQSTRSSMSSTKSSTKPPIMKCCCNWRASARFIFITRVSLAIFCFLMLSLASVLLGLGIKYYLEFKNLLQDDTGAETDGTDPPSFTMVPIYLLVIIGVLVAVTSFCGGIGSYVGDRCFLASYVVLISFMLLLLFIFLLVALFAYELIDGTVSQIFKDYTLDLYGTKEAGIALLDTFIDNTQKYHECCGFLKHEKPSNLSPSNVWLNILFWADSTNWGQLKALYHSFNENKRWDWVPRSCCKIMDDPTCNEGQQYYERLNWNDVLETHWQGKIWNDNCHGKALNFASMSGESKFISIVSMFIIFGLSITSIVFALFIYYNVKEIVLEKLKKDYELKRSKKSQKNIEDSLKKRRRRRKQKERSLSENSPSHGGQSVAITIETEESTSMTPLMHLEDEDDDPKSKSVKDHVVVTIQKDSTDPSAQQ